MHLPAVMALALTTSHVSLALPSPEWYPALALLCAFAAVCLAGGNQAEITPDMLQMILTGLVVAPAALLLVAGNTHTFLLAITLLIITSTDFDWVFRKPTINVVQNLAPLALAAEVAYVIHFVLTTPVHWQDETGLLWGLFLTGVGQVVIVAYHACRHFLGCFPNELHQPSRFKPAVVPFWQGALNHFAKPSAFALMGLYLSITYLFGWMPQSYYEIHEPVNWFHVLCQLVVVDLLTVINHLAEHSLPQVYIASHKPHHRFIAPNLFDAFDGSLADTALLILFPLFLTMRLLPMVNTWSYIAFGVSYSSHFLLIHSEWPHPWEPIAERFLGVYTSKHHQVHHAKFTYNYAHFFSVWDRMLGTFRGEL